MLLQPSTSVVAAALPKPLAADIVKECNDADVYEALEEILEAEPSDESELSDAEPAAVVSPVVADPPALSSAASPSNDEEFTGLTEEMILESIQKDMPSEEEVDAMVAFLKERGIVAFLQDYVVRQRMSTRRLLLAFGVALTPETAAFDEIVHLRLLKAALTKQLRKRDKLAEYNTVEDVVSLLRRSNRIMVLTGAGISVSCGIPDFRSRDGIYSMLADKPELELDDPQQMFDIEYFKENPAIFLCVCPQKCFLPAHTVPKSSFASHIYPSNFKPSPCHQFIKLLEDKDKLLRNYTQNIDTLEHAAGVRKVLQCHGSFATATCVQCGHHVPGETIRDDILAQRIPYCSAPQCSPPSNGTAVPATQKKKKPRNAKPWDDDDDEDDVQELSPAPGIMKPDITFFGEKLTDEFDRLLFQDRETVDLLLIMGTSLAVAPVADVLAYIPHSIPQVLINKTPVSHVNPDVVLLGDADTIVQHLCEQLGWTLPGSGGRKRPAASTDPERVKNSHVWLFEGAEGGRYVKYLQDGGDVNLVRPPFGQKRLRIV